MILKNNGKAIKSNGNCNFIIYRVSNICLYEILVKAQFWLGLKGCNAMKLIFPLLAVVGLAACSSIPPAPPTHKGTTAVIVTRPSLGLGSSCQVNVYLDGNFSGKLSNGSSLRLFTTPGEHDLYAEIPQGFCDAKSDQVVLRINPNQRKYYSVDLRNYKIKIVQGVTPR